MAVPARKTSKSKKRKRRTHKIQTKPEISFDKVQGEYRKSHYVSLNGFYGDRKVVEEKK